MIESRKGWFSTVLGNMVSELAEAVAKVEEHRGAPRVEIRAGMAPKTGMGMNFFGEVYFPKISKIRINITKQVDVWVKLRCNQSTSNQQEEP